MAIYTRTPRTDPTTKIREQFLKELENDANSMLRQLSQQFTQDIQSQLAQLAKDAASGTSQGSGLAGSASLIATAARYLVSRPKLTQNTEESARSREADAGFRLSRSQALAEANMMIARGEKNL